MSKNEEAIYYLKSISRQLKQASSLIAIRPTIGTEILADNRDWLDCYIDRLEKEHDPEESKA